MRPDRSFRGRLASVFLIAGIACVGIWAWSVGHEAVYQDWNNWAFDRRVAGQSASFTDYARTVVGLKDRPAPGASPTTETASDLQEPAPKGSSLIGRLSIPRLNVRAIVREGSSDGILSVALGHIAGTALPGQSGNVAVAGHRDTLFRGLRDVKVGDKIEFETPDRGKYLYEVEDTSIVVPTQVSVLEAGFHPQLTLVTCYPFNYVGSAPYRFIVKARQIGSDAKQVAPELVALRKQPVIPVKPIHRSVSLKPMPYNTALVYRSYRALPGQ